MEKRPLEILAMAASIVFCATYLISLAFGSIVAVVVEGILFVAFAVTTFGIYKNKPWAFGLGVSATFYSILMQLMFLYFGKLPDRFRSILTFSTRQTIIFALAPVFLVIIYFYEKDRKLNVALGSGKQA